MLKAIVVILAMSVAFIGCGKYLKETIGLTSELEKERQQSAGNASLAESLLEVKPPVDLNKTD